MTDRELLEAAAKAAGIAYQITNDGRFSIPLRSDGSIYWNPLTDDGDALRLAVKLQIGVRHRVSTVDASFKQTTHPMMHEDYGTDPYAATRRAIVRAAAEVGKAMT